MRYSAWIAVSVLALAVSAPALAAPRTSLVLAIGGESAEGYDPLFGWGRYGHPLFQSTLWRRDAALAAQPDLATDWTLSDDRLTWTFTIRPDARFSDGTPLTAEDVAFTFNRAAEAGSTVDLSVLAGAEAQDATTVVLRLEKPWITFTENFYALGIVPAASYDEGYARAPVGSGPYRLVSWTEGEQLIVERNPHYYGPPGAFETLTFLFVGEDTGYAAALAGQVDMVAVPAALADNVPSGFRQVVVPSVDNRGISFPVLPDEGRVDEEGLRIGNAVTSDRAIRRAVNLGLDRALLAEVALNGYGVPAHGPADGLPWAAPDAGTPYDPDAARALLDEAGWMVGSDGVRARDGVRAAFALNYPASDSTRQALALTAAELLRELGLEITATGVTWDVIGRIAHSEPVLFGWGSHSPVEVYNLYHSSGIGSGWYNVGYFADPVVDAHLDAAQAAESLEASYPHWQAAEWDGETGFGPKGEAAWAWLVNLDHIYFVTECLDIGTPQIEPHGHGWPITAGLADWTWTCP